MKHSPAPWTIVHTDTSTVDIRCAKDILVCEVGDCSVEDVANARLIAAAPELLDLLKKAQRLGLDLSIGNAYISRAYIDAQTELNAQIDAAIAKATGGAA